MVYIIALQTIFVVTKLCNLRLYIVPLGNNNVNVLQCKNEGN